MTHPHPPASDRASRGQTVTPRRFDYSALKARWDAQRNASASLSARLLEQVEREGAAVFRRYHATRATAFGSLVEGRAHARSDIDLIVFGTDPADYWALRRDLEETFGRPIDLHTESDDARFVSKAIARGKVIYAA
ncbi:nucleotidyltransferase family protein [Thiocapsa marina]|uniref:DNA polymerase beta domain protein region n=1 Tax=Thiocapsa marina 5811 TaxID=768671 RepID=F9UCW9_9GAMM|nr:nucleotidyltransferase domain-containing protein [Thiocapsa marina]EGV17713.1 DNA polymerase beta domain protein region [Thiocapsa marina 5811]